MILRLDPVTVLLVVFGLYVASDQVTDWREANKFSRVMDTNLDQAKQLGSMAGNMQEQSKVIVGLKLEQDQIEAQYEKTLTDKDREAGEQLGILATQAIQIAQTTPATDTIKHAETSKAFMKQAGGNTIDPGLAWNNAYIQQSLVEMDMLKQLLAAEKAEKARISAQLGTEINKADNLSLALVKKTEEHVTTAADLKAKGEAILAKDDLMRRAKAMAIYATCAAVIAGIAYVGFHIYQVISLKRRVAEEEERRREANRARYEHEKTANELKTAIKTFKAIGPEGNDQMDIVINANGLKKHFEDTPPTITPT